MAMCTFVAHAYCRNVEQVVYIEDINVGIGRGSQALERRPGDVTLNLERIAGRTADLRERDSDGVALRGQRKKDGRETAGRRHSWVR